ncbi:MAG: phage holin family protein, partial [Blastococcus sp.]
MSVNGRTSSAQSLGQLVSSVTSDVSSLLRLEIELAKSEIQQQVRQGATGGALAALAGFLGFLASILLSFAAVYGLANVMPVWAAFLVVAGAYLLLAGLLAFLGVRRFQQVKGPQRAQLQAQLTKETLPQHAEARA